MNKTRIEMKTTKTIRQYAGLIAAVLSYYLVHEGAHLLYALGAGAFKTIHVMGMGVQVDIYRERLTDAQLGWFCLVGPLATLLASWCLVALCPRIAKAKSDVVKAVSWYVTLTLLVLDPLYLAGIFLLVGGGDMNGIRLILPQTGVQVAAVILLILHLLIIYKRVLPTYSGAFAESKATTEQKK